MLVFLWPVPNQAAQNSVEQQSATEVLVILAVATLAIILVCAICTVIRKYMKKKKKI